jgi:hypothetical protein
MSAQERFEAQEPRPDDADQPDEGAIRPGQGTVPAEQRAPVSGTADLIRPTDDSVSTGSAEPSATRDEDDDGMPLLPVQSEQRFRSNWEAVQVGFVDEPRESVRRADQLVAELMQELAQGFADARSTLEAEWDRGEDVSTEDLRQALQRYRSFFQRLLAA